MLAAFALVSISLLATAEGRQSTRPRAADPLPPGIVEWTIPQLRDAMAGGRRMSRQIVVQVLTRIGVYEDRLHAAIAINPRALELAEDRDRERAEGRIRGPLHGIPIALKDNIHTTKMRTTGGGLALAGYTPPCEATLTKNLHDAGAIFIAKRGLAELANWVVGAPVPDAGERQRGRPLRLQPVRSAARSAPRELRRPARTPNRRVELWSGDGRQFWAASVAPTPANR